MGGRALESVLFMIQDLISSQGGAYIRILIMSKFSMKEAERRGEGRGAENIGEGGSVPPVKALISIYK